MTKTTEEKVTNVKTGKIGYVVGRYNRTSDGKGIVEVQTYSGNLATRHWIAAHVEAA